MAWMLVSNRALLLVSLFCAHEQELYACLLMLTVLHIRQWTIVLNESFQNLRRISWFINFENTFLLLYYIQHFQTIFITSNVFIFSYFRSIFSTIFITSNALIFFKLFHYFLRYIIYTFHIQCYIITSHFLPALWYFSNYFITFCAISYILFIFSYILFLFIFSAI